MLIVTRERLVVARLLLQEYREGFSGQSQSRMSAIITRNDQIIAEMKRLKRHPDCGRCSTRQRLKLTHLREQIDALLEEIQRAVEAVNAGH